MNVEHIHNNIYIFIEEKLALHDVKYLVWVVICMALIPSTYGPREETFIGVESDGLLLINSELESNPP